MNEHSIHTVCIHSKTRPIFQRPLKNLWLWLRSQMKELQNFLYFCYVIHQIKLRAGLFHWNFWVGQVNLPDIFDLHVRL